MLEYFLGARDASDAWVDLTSLLESTRESLEERFSNVVTITAIQNLSMDIRTEITRHSTEEFFYQSELKILRIWSVLRVTELKVWSIRKVDHYPAKSLIHGRIGTAISNNPGLIAQGFIDRLPNSNGTVFGRMMLIDMQITFDPQFQINQRMPRELFNHMIQKTNAGGHFIFPGSIEIQLDENLGFLGVSFYFRTSHGKSL